MNRITAATRARLRMLAHVYPWRNINSRLPREVADLRDAVQLIQECADIYTESQYVQGIGLQEQEEKEP
jgi:hypothetical protein